MFKKYMSKIYEEYGPNVGFAALYIVSVLLISTVFASFILFLIVLNTVSPFVIFVILFLISCLLLAYLLHDKYKRIYDYENHYEDHL